MQYIPSWLLSVLCCWEVGRFRVGVGLGAQVWKYEYLYALHFWHLFFNISFMLLHIQLITCILIWHIKKTTESNEVPCMLENYAKGVPWKLKSIARDLEQASVCDKEPCQIMTLVDENKILIPNYSLFLLTQVCSCTQLLANDTKCKCTLGKNINNSCMIK